MLYAFGCKCEMLMLMSIVAIWGEVSNDLARDWRYTKLSISSAPLLSFSGMCSVLFLFFGRFCFALFCFVLLSSCSCWSFADDSLVLYCPADRPRTGLATTYYTVLLLGKVKARSVNVNNTHTQRVA